MQSSVNCVWSPRMRTWFALLLLWPAILVSAQGLPFDTVFKGQDRFERMLAQMRPQAASLKAMPIGERVAWFGQSLLGTPYKGFTLEIDDQIEAPSVNLTGLDCWTFFEVSLALARMAEADPGQWSALALLRWIEVDRYWGGRCNGSYLSRLHYLEDWASDNERRGLVRDLTRSLGAVAVGNAAVEMTNHWKSYRYMVKSAANREGISKLEARLRAEPIYMIPLAKIAGIESQLQNGDIISIVSTDNDAYGTSHVGLALRRAGTLHFMHASAPKNQGKVVVDSRLSEYVGRYKRNVGIMVARPLR
jgi:Protein of unknown function (DUF1460)